MQSFEAELKQYFLSHQITFEDHCASHRQLDFSFGDPKAKTRFCFDVKEKRQRYDLKNWQQIGIPEHDLFIIDDLAARKILAFAPNSGLVVRDNLHRTYHFFSVVDLYLMPKKRVNRVIHRQIKTMKGKWMIDLRNGKICDKLLDVFAAIESYLANRKTIFLQTLECYGNYQGEEVGQGGIIRRPGHWDIDVKGTR